jgi:Spy/CpxP family protein refolding chaperone
MKKYFLSIFMLFFMSIAVISAQRHRSEGHDRKEKVESLRIAYISEKLDLTPEEAQRFWPVYNQFRDQQKAIVREARADKNLSEMSAAEADAQVNKNLEREEKMLALRKDFHKKLKGVIPSEKIVRLQNIEQDFKKEVLERVKERRRLPDAPPSPPKAPKSPPPPPDAPKNPPSPPDRGNEE